MHRVTKHCQATSMMSTAAFLTARKSAGIFTRRRFLYTIVTWTWLAVTWLNDCQWTDRHMTKRTIMSRVFSRKHSVQKHGQDTANAILVAAKIFFPTTLLYLPLLRHLRHTRDWCQPVSLLSEEFKVVDLCLKLSLQTRRNGLRCGAND